MREEKKRRKGIAIMRQLTGLVKPLIPIMCAAVFLGVLGYLCAIFLTVVAGYGLLGIFLRKMFILLENWLLSYCFWLFYAGFFIMENSTVIILLRLSFWLLSVTKCLQLFESFVLQNWKGGKEEI